MYSNYTIIKTASFHFLKSILVWVILFSNTVLKAQYDNDSVFNASVISKIELEDASAEKKFFLSAEQNTKPFTLFVFLSPECPVCQNYSNKLNQLNKQYADHIAMYGIIPGKAYSADVIKNFIRQYNIQFPLLIDQDKKLTSYLQASVTPQVILLNDKNDLIYKGAIDNWAVSPGKQRVTTTAYFLHDALERSLDDETILIKRTKAVGCRINDY